MYKRNVIVAEVFCFWPINRDLCVLFKQCEQNPRYNISSTVIGSYPGTNRAESLGRLVFSDNVLNCDGSHILLDFTTRTIFGTCCILQIMLVICNLTDFCEMYTEYSCYRKCHVNLYNTLQMCGKFLSSLYSKALRKHAESRSLLHPVCNTSIVQKIHNTYLEARLTYVIW